MSNAIKKAVQRMSAFRKHSNPKTVAVETLLDNAKPAERIWDQADYEHRGVEVITRLGQTGGQSDGLWLCHCHHENSLTHFQGRLPFKQLKCGKCEHVLCSQCLTTEILTKVEAPSTEIFAKRCRLGQNGWPYCTICQSCGLSHRAIMVGGQLKPSLEKCPCRTPFPVDSTLYLIGSVVPWRCDPHGRAQALSLERLGLEKDEIARSANLHPITDRALKPAQVFRSNTVVPTQKSGMSARPQPVKYATHPVASSLLYWHNERTHVSEVTQTPPRESVAATSSSIKVPVPRIVVSEYKPASRAAGHRSDSLTHGWYEHRILETYE